MASAMRQQPGQQVLAQVPIGTRRDAMLTERQLELSRRWSYYKAAQYDVRSFDWDGRKRGGQSENETIASRGYVPSGFTDATKTLDDLPAKFRRPVAPYHLVRSVVRRFTSLLFGARTHPTVDCLDDWDTGDYVQGLLTATMFWAKWGQARKYGGGQGSACVTFAFVNGAPMLEVHDPRYVTPTFRDPRTRELDSLEIKYQFAKDERQHDGSVKAVLYLYRRVIAANCDVTYKPIRCDDDGAQWVELERYDHNLGEVPGVWVCNTDPELGDLDGEPDCLGIFDQSEEIDALLSQGSVGVKSNCDPTVHLSTDLELNELRKGSKHALKTEKGSSATLLETNGSGATAARDMAKMHRDLALEVVSCVIETPGLSAQTATEVDRSYEAMWDRADEFRETYAEHGIKPLLSKMLRAVRRLTTVVVDPVTGAQTVGLVIVPPRIEQVETQAGDGSAVTSPRVPGVGTLLEVTWPPWSRPTATDAQTAAGAASVAVAGKILDRQTAVAYVAPMFGGSDPAEIERRIAAEEASSMDAEANRLLAEAGSAAPQAQAATAEISMEELRADLCLVNEWRASKGLPPLPDGNVAWTVYQAKQAAADRQQGDAGMPPATITALLAVVTAAARGDIPRLAAMALVTATTGLSVSQAAAMIPEPEPPPAPPPMLMVAPPPPGQPPRPQAGEPDPGEAPPVPA